MTRALLLFAILGASVLAQEVTLRPRFDAVERLADWTLDGNGTWEISKGLLILAKPGTPGGPIRRPAALAILKSEPFVRATVEVQVRSTAPIETIRRDVQLIAGYESPTRFYYAHLSAITDDVHNGIFVVLDADRRRIDDGKGVPHLKDQEWHRIRLEYDGKAGRIEVYVDGSARPVLAASDTTIRQGRVGLGSFDDTGEFKEFTVRWTR